MLDPKFVRECEAWTLEQLEGLTDEMPTQPPSEYIEQTRYLPASVTPLPGYYDYDVMPMWREIVDCFDIDSPVREVNVMKGVQIAYTTNLENILLYFADRIKTVPVMFMTADAELAAARIEHNIIPMFNHSGRASIIQSNDEFNPRKTGKTKDYIQWMGGGYLVPFGANNAAKMRTFSILALLKDELDAWPDTVGKDGDPDKLSDDRCAAYYERRKIFRGSTPLIAGQSKIDVRFKEGDQRRYFVRCLKCGFPQYLVFSGVNRENGVKYGLLWETDGGRLVIESVRYACQNCGHGHHEHDKVKLFAKDHGAEWRPTATPISDDIRSYHLPALYSPAGMQPWHKSVSEWLGAWDEEHRRPRDMGKLQVFYNNVLAQPFELRGEKLTFATVSAHRRQVYKLGMIPNTFAQQYAGGPVGLLICTVDVHKSNLLVAVHGFSRSDQGGRAFTVDYWRWDGEPIDNADDPATWGKLRELIESKEYTADDGKRYRIALTLVDASYSNEKVVAFCSEYAAGVIPILGRDTPSKNQTIKEFAPFVTQAGTTGYRVTVDLYKDRWSANLRRSWDGLTDQPRGHYNAPLDITDKQLKELTVERKREKVDAKTGRRVGFEWHRPGNVQNGLWDLLIYASAGLDLVAWDVSRNQLGLEFVNWPAFWDHCEAGAYFENS